MSNRIYPGQTIGIIGAGQLGKMLAQSGQKMGYKIASYDPNPSACGFNVSHSKVVASFDDRQALLDFVSSVDTLTYEFENINGELLEEMKAKAHFPQGTKLLLASQNRQLEKEWLTSIGTKVVDFRRVESWEDLVQATNDLGFPSILKTTRFGYDGKGQWKLNSEADMTELKAEIEAILQNQSCVLEAFCPFEYEISVMVSRDSYGHIEVFPISYNVHRAGILFASLVGLEFSTQIQAKVKDYSEKIAREGQLIGVCGVEFFVTAEGDVLINEIAPRPHNTGHYSIEATNVSQFDQHILAVTHREIVPVNLLSPVLMINILGQHMELLDDVMDEFPTALIHIYDKGEAKTNRKMGHFTILADNAESLKEMLSKSDLLLKWQQMY